MKILLLGANGQVGHELRRALAPLGEVVAATRDGQLADGAPCVTADLADPASLARALDAARADVIVNAAAYTAVDRAEDEPGLAERINGAAVGEIGAWAAKHGARVVHFSTDYVFDGTSSRPYREDDTTAPLGVYGRTKLAGEQALQASGAPHLILRTSWVYAARGHNFLRTMLRLGADRDEVAVVDDQTGAPTPAHGLADATAMALRQWNTATGAQSSRLFHLTAAGACTWCGFAKTIFDRARRRGLLEHDVRVRPITTAEYPTRARRPAYSVLDNSRVNAALAVQLPDWRIGLDEVLDEVARAGA